jgi:hypothetical protein
MPETVSSIYPITILNDFSRINTGITYVYDRYFITKNLFVIFADLDHHYVNHEKYIGLT